MIRPLAIALWLLILVLLLFYTLAAARAQHDHAQHHAFYQNWENKDGKGCCNNQDCGTLAAENERERDGRIEVRVEGEWCRVEPRHYLRTGNAPDWSSAHVCVRRNFKGVVPQHPCARLLCYQPKPLF